MKITVSVLDDHPVVINGLQKMLAEFGNIELYDACTQENHLMDALEKRQPDVLLLDIQMDGTQGDELSLAISDRYPDIQILALTNLNHPFHVRNMFLNGARGYLLKTAPPHILLKAIETVCKGEQYVDPTLRERMLHDMLENRANANNVPVLTRREREILELIANETTSQEIAKKLFISLSAVESHRINLLSKLGVKNSVGLIRKAIQMGLIR